MTQDATTYYVWIGGSCDYCHKERAHQEAVARKAAAKAQRQKEQEAKKETPKKVKVVVTPAPKAESVKEQKSAKAVETPKEVKAVKEEVSTKEAPQKRVRQRIRITSATPVREKVEFFKKK